MWDRNLYHGGDDNAVSAPLTPASKPDLHSLQLWRQCNCLVPLSLSGYAWGGTSWWRRNVVTIAWKSQEETQAQHNYSNCPSHLTKCFLQSYCMRQPYCPTQAFFFFTLNDCLYKVWSVFVQIVFIFRKFNFICVTLMSLLLQEKYIC